MNGQMRNDANEINPIAMVNDLQIKLNDGLKMVKDVMVMMINQQQQQHQSAKQASPSITKDKFVEHDVLPPTTK